MAAAPALKKGLNDRQLRMIAIGGVIGAGLFVGSGVVIRSTVPSVGSGRAAFERPQLANVG